ncbi:MAG TPA: TonB-dependent receptor [Chryseosolibacter sp.]|nr:TonB-dependent receptor [Chryseosolibacter sp.]
MRFYSLLICVLSSPTLFGQAGDTTYLQTVEVYGMPMSNYAIGAKIKEIQTGDEVTMLPNALAGLASVYLKNYGNGQLSTIGLRGTTASQTAVLWNGININSPSLGLTDLSLIPLFFSSDVAVQYGTSSSLYGSDAIGGTIVLGQNRPDFQNRFSIKLYQGVGSFGHVSTGASSIYGHKRIQAKTSLYRMKLENDFPFYSPAVGYEKIQNHARVYNYGLNQHLSYQLKQNQTISVEGMFIHNNREIQPAVTNNLANEELLDENIRTSMTYDASFTSMDVKATVASLSYYEIYSDGYDEENEVDQLSAIVNINHHLTSRTSLRYGMANNSYRASSENYEAASESQEIFASFRSSFKEVLNYNLNLRQIFVDGELMPLTPSVGLEGVLLKNAKRKLVLTAQGGRGYRLPTLNDRFWQPGGNPSLEPEDALQVETGLNYVISQAKCKGTFAVNAYRSWIDDMIIWKHVTGVVWSPVNLQVVHVNGLELETAIDASIGRHVIGYNLSYAFTESTNKKALHESDPGTVGSQIPYVPLHSLNTRASVSLRRLFDFQTTYQYTGRRQTDLINDDYKALEAFGLWSISLSKQFAFTSVEARLSFSVNNIADVYFENLKNHAMPGRNYLATITLNYNR